MTRCQLIEYGLFIFKITGASSICDVCIDNGGSCCSGCQYLKEGIGCQRRNTACTAWLCGIQKFYFKEIGLLENWEEFWKQVPGQCFRADQTPEKVMVKPMTELSGVSKNLGDSVAKKIASFTDNGGDISKLERYLDINIECGNKVGFSIF